MISAIQSRLAKLEASRKGQIHVVAIWEGQTDEEAWALANPDQPFPAAGMLIFIRKFRPHEPSSGEAA